jgi:esterase
MVIRCRIRTRARACLLFLVHGTASDYRTWVAQVPTFQSKLRVINVSLRHFYPERWDGSGTDFSIAQHATDVAQFIKNLNLGKVHLVGHPRGGAVVGGENRTRYAQFDFFAF